METVLHVFHKKTNGEENATSEEVREEDRRITEI